MCGQSLASATRFVVGAAGLLYAAVGGLALVDFDHTRDIVLWTAFLAVGAVVGGLALFWTLLVPIAPAAVVACSIALARRGTAPA